MTRVDTVFEMSNIADSAHRCTEKVNFRCPGRGARSGHPDMMAEALHLLLSESALRVCVAKCLRGSDLMQWVSFDQQLSSGDESAGNVLTKAARCDRARHFFSSSMRRPSRWIRA